MTVDRFRLAADRGRKAADRISLRLYTVAVVKTVWSGGAVGSGSPTTTTTTLVPNPRVRTGDDARKLTVGPITPSYAVNGGGGYAFETLRPTQAAGVEYHYTVTGPFTATGLTARSYDLEGIEEDRPLHYTLHLVISEVHSPTI